jgi:hypothetical protein
MPVAFDLRRLPVPKEEAPLVAAEDDRRLTVRARP